MNCSFLIKENEATLMDEIYAHELARSTKRSDRSSFKHLWHALLGIQSQFFSEKQAT